MSTLMFSVSKRNVLIVLSFITLYLIPMLGYAGQVVLAWDPIKPTPKGYRLYQRLQGQNYDYKNPVWNGSKTTATIKNLKEDKNYFFVVRAFNSALESSNSNEVSLTLTSGSSSTVTDSGTSSSGSSGTSSGSTTTVSGSAVAQSTDGLVILNPTKFNSKASRSNHNWAAVNHLGVGAMESMPDSGARIVSSYVSESPYLRFNVNFKKTGTHYIWLRASCLGSDNTAHVGLNGNAFASGTNIKVPLSKDWAWGNTIAGGSRAKINVSKTGLQTVEVYMREDGMILHKVVITKSSSYKPTGSGPAQSTLQ